MIDCFLIECDNLWVKIYFNESHYWKLQIIEYIIFIFKAQTVALLNIKQKKNMKKEIVIEVFFVCCSFYSGIGIGLNINQKAFRNCT